MKVFDSMWWHSSPQNGSLASSHIGIVFCALLQNGMIVSDLADMEFDSVPSFKDRRLSPMEYCLAYTDGVIYEEYVVRKYREQVIIMMDNGDLYKLLAENDSLSRQGKGTYNLKDSWNNVDQFSLELYELLK